MIKQIMAPDTKWPDGISVADIDAFIDRWEKSGGSELANFQTFAGDLCRLLRLPEPEPSLPENEYNNYVFERRIDFKLDDGGTTPGRIDPHSLDPARRSTEVTRDIAERLARSLEDRGRGVQQCHA